MSHLFMRHIQASLSTSSYCLQFLSRFLLSLVFLQRLDGCGVPHNVRLAALLQHLLALQPGWGVTLRSKQKSGKKSDKTCVAATMAGLV